MATYPHKDWPPDFPAPMWYVRQELAEKEVERKNISLWRKFWLAVSSVFPRRIE